MPDPNIRGVQPLSWGTEAITGFINESQTESESTDEMIIENEEGAVVTQITGFGRKSEVTLEIIPKQGATLPVPGDVLTYGVSSKKITILTIQKKRIKKDVEKWTVTGNRYPDITLT